MRRAAAEGSVAVVARETRRGGVVVSDGRPHLPLSAQPSAAAVWVAVGVAEADVESPRRVWCIWFVRVFCSCTGRK
jgi:hypothetical protein